MKKSFHIVCLILLSGSLLLFESCKIFRNNKADSDNGSREGSNFDALYLDACTQYNIGNYNNAIKLFVKCSDLKPEEASSYYQLSRAYAKNSENPKAMQNASKAYELSPSNIWYVLWYAELLKSNGNSAEALKILEKAFASNPENEQLLKLLDAIYIQKSDGLKYRIDIWEKHKKASKYKLSTSLKLIDLYKRNKDYKKAHIIYDEIKQASPLKYQYFIEDANLYLEENDELNARINFDKALAINPNNFQLNHSLFKMAVAKNDFKSAETYLTQALNDPLTGTESKLLLCAELNKKIKTDTSYGRYLQIAAFQLVKLYPENPEVLLTAADFHNLNGRYELALFNYKKVTELKPGLYEAWTGALTVSDSLGLFEEKLKLAEKALEFYPAQAVIYLRAAEACNSIKNAVKAKEYALSGLSFAFDDVIKSALLREMGRAFYLNSDYDNAEKTLLAALAINSSDKQLYDYMGDLFARQGKRDQAIESWKKARALGLNSAILDQKILEGKNAE